jgi:hypothetical protein
VETYLIPGTCSYLLGHPNVNTKASTPASRNSISNRRSTIGLGLADQLVHPLVVGAAIAALVDVDAVGSAGWLAVEAGP